MQQWEAHLIERQKKRGPSTQKRLERTKTYLHLFPSLSVPGLSAVNIMHVSLVHATGKEFPSIYPLQRRKWGHVILQLRALYQSIPYLQVVSPPFLSLSHSFNRDAANSGMGPNGSSV